MIRTLTTVLLLYFALLTALPASSFEQKAPIDSCLACHGDAGNMTDLGYPHLTITAEQAQKQTRMTASCTACHLGNPAASTREEAHKGLLRAFYVKNKKFEATTRDKLIVFAPGWFEPRGKNPMISLLPLVEKDGKLVKDPDVQTMLYHDKNPNDLSCNYPALEQTCGTCHRKEVDEFRKTAMGHNAKQRQYRTWTDEKRGPHNCGVWFVDGYADIVKNTKVPFTPEQAAVNQKACNTCHVGCLDCHYTPSTANPAHPDLGQHTFSKKVSALTCYGDGRGSICHAGPEDRRRGGGYIGGAFSTPVGSEADVHFAKKIECTDCHDTAAQDRKLLHGQVKRQVNCTKCHNRELKAVAASVHHNVSCEACHTHDVGAYAATFWGPGVIGGVQTPFYKYKDYYGIMKYPVLIRNQKGVWIPVKPYPMAVLNQKTAGNLKPGLAWRFPATLPDLERTDDAYAFVDLAEGLPGNDYALLWIQMDKVSHKYGKARPCESCHTADNGQRQEVLWKYSDQGAEPFDGRHVVTANSKGLFITDMEPVGQIKVREGWKLEDFAPWMYLKDAWKVKGNFAIPVVKKKAEYERDFKRYQDIMKTGGSFHQ
ncbi:MAG TPA: cytochrome c3 family protein [Nitrospirota bacterium]|nr:cytochrome c3 family protein [Nitrospirota bacterium]